MLRPRLVSKVRLQNQAGPRRQVDPCIGIFRAMALELQPAGIKTLILQPGSFRTDIRDLNRVHVPKTVYHNEMTDAFKTFMEQSHGAQEGDPEKLANIMIDIVKGTGVAEGKQVPMTLPLGPDAFAMAKFVYEQNMRELKAWEDVIKSTDHDVQKGGFVNPWQPLIDAST